MAYTYPGVYINELPSPVHAITGVATSIAAFIGYTPRGIDNRAQAIFSFADFERLYGGLSRPTASSATPSRSSTRTRPGSRPTCVPGAADGRRGRVGDVRRPDVLRAVQRDMGQRDAAHRRGPGGAGQPHERQAGVQPDRHEPGRRGDRVLPGLTLDKSSTNYVATVINDPDNGSQLVNVSDDANLPSPLAALEVTGVVGSADHDRGRHDRSRRQHGAGRGDN